MRLRAKFTVAIGTFVLSVTAPAFAGPPQGSGPPGEKGKPAAKAHDEKGKADGKDKADKEKGDKAEKATKDDKPAASGAPPGLEAKDDEHHKKLLERFEERKKTAKDRATSERDESRRKLGPLLGDQAVQQELRRHANAVARLERVKEIADADEKADLSSRATAALAKENARHDKRVAALASQKPPAASASQGAP